MIVAEHLRPLGISYDPEVVEIVRKAGEALGGVRANAAFRLWEDRADPDTVIEEVAHWGLTSRKGGKAGQFLLHPTWRAYISCYVEGLPLCRAFVAGDPVRFRGSSPSSSHLQDLVEQTVIADKAAEDLLTH